MESMETKKGNGPNKRTRLVLGPLTTGGLFRDVYKVGDRSGLSVSFPFQNILSVEESYKGFTRNSHN